MLVLGKEKNTCVTGVLERRKEQLLVSVLECPTLTAEEGGRMMNIKTANLAVYMTSDVV